MENYDEEVHTLRCSCNSGISLGTSAMAQQVISEPGVLRAVFSDANCQNEGPNNPSRDDYQHRISQSNSYVSNGVCAQGGTFYRRRDGGKHT